jgi:gliding motility-associated lipoprotein GldH
MKTALVNSGYLLAFAWLLAACDAGCLTEKQLPMLRAEWHKDSIATLTLPVTDTVNACAVIITLRNDEDYPYNNIILAVTATAPSGVTTCDTVEYRLTDEHEFWRGKVGGKWIDNRLAFRSGVRFLYAGDYTFSIAHLMRRDILSGIGAVGIRIEEE